MHLFRHLTVGVRASARLTLAILTFTTATSFGLAPPRPGEIEQMQADGTYEEALERAKSFGNHQMNPALVSDAQERLRSQMLESAGVTPKMQDLAKTPVRTPRAAPKGARNLPTMGTPRTLTLLIDFADAVGEAPSSMIHSAMYGTGDSAYYPYESLTKYYERSSYGKLRIQGDTIGWFRYSQTRAQIAATHASIRAQRAAGTISNYDADVQENVIRENMIRDALQSVNATTDFTRYDNNNDGKIDSLVVVYAGPNTGWGSFWWAYKTGAWAGTLNTTTFDGKAIDGYIFEFGEYHRDGNTVLGFDPTTTIHETGHILGLPDLYDYDAAVGPPGGVGGLDMMHGNKGDLNSYFKWLLDWKTPLIMGSGHKFLDMKPQATSDREAVVMMPGLAANGWFSDDFTSVTGYIGQWQKVTPLAGTSTIAWANQRVEFQGRAHLRTVAEFDPLVLGGVKVAGKWTFVNAGDTFQAATRTDGVPSPSLFQEVGNGVIFQVANTGVLSIYDHGTALTVEQLSTGSVGAIPAGSSWNFEIFDDKDTGLAFRFTKADNPAITATVIGKVTQDTFGSNRIAFYNRELIGDRSYLDDIAILPGPTATDMFSELYVVENRSAAGNDDADNWPGGRGEALNFSGGLAIWHVDARLNAAGDNFAWNSSTTSHKLLRLMEADGLEQIEQNRDADARDLWAPGVSFDSRSTPNSNNYAGAFTGIAVTPIRNWRGTIYTHLSFWTNPAWRRPSISLTTPAAGTTTVNASITVTALASDQSQDGIQQPPVVEFYRDGEFAPIARWDGVPAGQSEFSTSMNMAQLGTYQLTGLAADRDNYPLVVAALPESSIARTGLLGEAPLVNTFWSTATALTGNGITLTATNIAAGVWPARDEADDPSVSAQPNQSKRVWWKWTAPVSGRLSTTTLGSNFDTVLALYTGGRLDALRELASNDDIGPGVLSSNISGKWVYAGTTVYIMVSGYNGTTGSISLALSFAPELAPNDNLSSTLATDHVLSGNGASVPWILNESATTESGENAITQHSSSRSVWYRFSPTASGRLTLDTSGSGYDTVLQVFRSTASSLAATTMSTLTSVGFNDDFYGLRRTSALGVNVTAGQHYFVLLDGYNADHRGYAFLAWKFTSRAANSNPSASIVTPQGTATMTKGATLALRITASDNDGFVNNVTFYADAARTQIIANIPANPESRWETFWTPPPGLYVVSALATDDEGGTTLTNSVLVIVRDLTTNDLTRMVDDNTWIVREIVKPSGFVDSLVDADALIASGAALERVTYTRSLNFRDPGFGGAGLLPDATYPPAAWATNNLTNFGQISGDDDDFVTVAWCRFTVATAGNYTFGFSSDDGARLRLYNGSFQSSVRLNTANPANPAHNGGTLSFPANTGNSDTLGTAYLIPGTYALEFTAWERAGGAHAEVFVASGTKTAFDGTFTPVGQPGGPLVLVRGGIATGNDAFAAARLLQGPAPVTVGSTVGATREAGETLAPGTGGSVWFQWTAPESRVYQFSTVGSQGDTVLGIYTGSAVNALTQIAVDQDSGGSQASLTAIAATAGVTYRIAVWGQTTATGSLGNYTLSITPRAPLMVTSGADSGAGTLRQVLADAAVQHGADTVSFAPALTAPVTLASELLFTDTAAVIIDGSDRPKGVIIDAGQGTNRHLRVDPGTSLILQRLRFYGGGGTGGGAPPNYGGSVHNNGTLTLRECTFADNSSSNIAGAVYNQTGLLTVERCTFHNNTAGGVGALLQESQTPMIVTASTFTNNIGRFEGGAITLGNFRAATITHCTITGNHVTMVGGGGGGGIRSIPGAGNLLTLTHSIVTDNTDANSPGLPNAIPGPGSSNNLTTGDAYLATLGDYGGPTWTMPPIFPSEAIDAAASSTANTDQRGTARPLDADFAAPAIHDIGAVEAAAPIVVNTAADQNDVPAGPEISLREAIRDAAAGASVFFNTNVFNGEPADHIVLGSSISFTKGIILDAGGNPGRVTINGGPGTHRLFFLPPATGAFLRNFTLTGGDGGGPGAYGASGGAIYSETATLALADCTLTGNSTSVYGGAILNAQGTLTLDRCLLSANTSSNVGGAVNSITAALTGPATSGMWLTNCTITGNTTGAAGGGIANGTGRASLLHCTITANTSAAGTASGVDSFANNETRTTVQNCIIAGNSGTNNVGAGGINSFVSLGGNVIGNGSATAAFNQLRDSINQTATTLRLAPLGDNSGPTQTMALRPGSPALSNATASTVSIDQRSLPAVGAKDSGAHEAGHALLYNYTLWAWESLPHTATAPQIITTADFDHDGTDNYNEWLAQTDPGNPGSTFLPVSSMEMGDLTITFPTVTGRTYTLQQSDTLAAGSWVNFAAPLAGTGSPESFVVSTPTATRRFYRVAVGQ